MNSKENANNNLRQDVEKTIRELTEFRSRSLVFTQSEKESINEPEQKIATKSEKQPEKTKAGTTSSNTLSSIDDTVEKEHISENATVSENIVKALSKRGFKIDCCQMPDPPKLIKEMANTLAVENERLSLLMKQIRYAISNSPNNAGNIVLKGTPDENAFIYAVIDRLHRLGFLVQAPQRNGNTVNFVVTKNEKCNCFLTGGWLEFWAYETAITICKDMELDFEAMTNVRLMKDDGSNKVAHELDLLLYVENQLLWVESKSGEFINSLQKYHDLGRSIGVVPQYTVLVAAKLTDNNESEALSYNYDYHICSTAAFTNTLAELILRIKVENENTNNAIERKAA